MVLKKVWLKYAENNTSNDKVGRNWFRSVGGAAAPPVTIFRGGPRGAEAHPGYAPER